MNQPLIKLKRPLRSVGLLFLVLLFNPFSVTLFRRLWGIEWVNTQYLHEVDAYFYLPLTVCFFSLGLLYFMQTRETGLREMYKASASFNFFLFLSLGLLILFTNGLDAGHFRLFRILALGALFTLGLRTAALWWVHPLPERRLRGIRRKISLMVFPLLLTLILLEIPFLYLSRSHNFVGTLSARTWVADHRNLNSWGYRDREYSPAEWKKKRVLWVVGDSFVEGYGIADNGDRFSEILANEIGEGWIVLNAGKGGSDVWDATERIKTLPVKPDMVLFSYYPNDIQMDCGKEFPMPMAKSYADIPAPVRFVVRRSYLLNYFYWKFPHPSELGDYNQYTRNCYDDPAVWKWHTAGMDSLIALSRRQDFELMTMVWPFLTDIESFESPTQRVAAHFESEGIPTLNITPLLRHLPPDSLVVNANDYHANERTHGIVGRALIPMVRARSHSALNQNENFRP